MMWSRRVGMSCQIPMQCLFRGCSQQLCQSRLSLATINAIPAQSSGNWRTAPGGGGHSPPHHSEQHARKCAQFRGIATHLLQLGVTLQYTAALDGEGRHADRYPGVHSVCSVAVVKHVSDLSPALSSCSWRRQWTFQLEAKIASALRSCGCSFNILILIALPCASTKTQRLRLAWCCNEVWEHHPHGLIC